MVVSERDLDSLADELWFLRKRLEALDCRQIASIEANVAGALLLIEQCLYNLGRDMETDTRAPAAATAGPAR